MSDKKPDLRVHVLTEDERDGPTFRLRCVVVNVIDTGKIRSISSWDHDVKAYADLYFEAYLDAYAAKNGDEELTFPRVGYKTYGLVLMDELETKYKMLKTITTKLTRLDERFGRTDVLGQLARFGTIIGVPAEAGYITTNGTGDWDSAEAHYLDADGVRHYVWRRLREWEQKHGFRAVAS